MATAPTTAAPPPRRPRLPYQTPRDTWDRDSCLAALEDWARRFGRPPRAYEWSPSHGRTAGLLAGDRLCVWERDHPRWPATGTVIRHCGPWLVALHAAGVGAARPDRGGRSQRERVEAAQRLAAEGLGRAAIAELLEVHSRHRVGLLARHAVPRLRRSGGDGRRRPLRCVCAAATVE